MNQTGNQILQDDYENAGDMTKNEKRLVLNGIFLPVVLAIILSVLFVGPNSKVLSASTAFVQ